MGWTTTYKPKGEGIIDFLARHCINCSNEYGTWTLLKGKVIKGVAYMAIHRTLTSASGIETYVFAGVFKVQMYPNASDNHNFGYKDMDESCGPHYYDCPADILDMLSPTTSEYALDWRAQCRKNISASSAVKLTKGAILVFSEAIRFSNGFCGSKFRVEDARRGIVSSVEQGAGFAQFKIKNLRDRVVNGGAQIVSLVANQNLSEQMSLIGGAA